MQLKVSDACPSRCGVRVEGEVDLDTREFVHRFGIPAAAATLVTPNETEVDRMRLVTFGPSAARASRFHPVLDLRPFTAYDALVADGPLPWPGGDRGGSLGLSFLFAS